MLVRFRRFGHPHSAMIPALIPVRLRSAALLSCAVLTGFAVLMPPSLRAQELASVPAAAALEASQVRLIAGSGPEQGIYRAAVDVTLPPAAITYWRQPGEAGVPPRFSFVGSQNVAAVDVLYPVPGRFDEDGLEAYGYRGGVIFPLHVTPKEAGKPAVLRLSLDYAVCEKICIPARADAEIALPGAASAPARSLIAAAEARVPVPLKPEEIAEKLSVAAKADAAKPTWIIAAKDGADLGDVFAEAPEGWYFETHRLSKGEYALVAADRPPAAAPAPVAVKLTVAGARPYESTVTLAPARPAAEH